MRICIISNFKKNGYGESARPYYLSLFLKKQGHEVIHLCRHQGVEENIRYIKVDTNLWEPSLLKRLAGFIPLYIRLNLFAPDIIYGHQLNIVRWAVQTKVLPKSRLIMDAHTSMYFEHSMFGENDESELTTIKTIEAAAYRSVEYIICASEETRQFLIKKFELNPQKLFAVGNATGMVPVTMPEKKRFRKTDSHMFTCLATLPQDGFASNEMALLYLLEIAAMLYPKDPRIRFIVVGGGEKPVPATPNITYTGYVQDLRREILSADICLMPFPDRAVCGGARNKFCDYIALGKLVITSPEGLRGMEILEDKKNCLVARDQNDFVETILHLSRLAFNIEEIEEEVFKIKDYYSWESRAKQVNDIFEMVLKSK